MLLVLQLNNLLPGGPDTIPNPFSFTDQSSVARSTTITSAAITVSGIDTPTTITVSGGTYDINGSGSFTSSSGTVNNGDTVRARHTSSASYSTAVNTTVTIGGVSDTFTSTTQVDPSLFTAVAAIAGTAMAANGVMGALFLDDSTPVPATAVSIEGFAHRQDGMRYVALWPASNVAFYARGIARRSDGAMIIAPGGTIGALRSGWALTSRGEVVAAASIPQIVRDAIGLLQDGTLCLSAVS